MAAAEAPASPALPMAAGLMPRVQAPANVAKGEVFQVRTLVTHPMETGLRHDSAGRVVPADLVRRFTCHYDHDIVFQAELHEGMAANPYLAFHVRAEETGTLHFLWEADGGIVARLDVPVTVGA